MLYTSGVKSELLLQYQQNIRLSGRDYKLFPELFTGLFLGLFMGVISGLIPGIHANTMAGFLLSFQAAVLLFLGPEAMAVSLFCALITHTFLDIIPSAVFGIPDADTAITVLPAHNFILEGRGSEAVRLSAVGGLYAVIFSMPLIILFFTVLPVFQDYIDWWIGILLIAVAGILALSSESPEWFTAVFLTSGILGVFTFNYPYLATGVAGQSGILMPLLTGLFGISVLLFSSGGVMPEQGKNSGWNRNNSIFKCSLAGTAAGAVVGWLPGLSNASANAVLASVLNYDKDGGGFIVATGAANTANAFLGLAALYALSRTRNGIMVAISLIDLPPMLLLVAFGALAAMAAYLITFFLAGRLGVFKGFNVRNVGITVILFCVVLSFILTGPYGLFILGLATAVGVVPSVINVRRVSCMGAIMLPVILWSLELM